MAPGGRGEKQIKSLCSEFRFFSTSQYPFPLLLVTMPVFSFGNHFSLVSSSVLRVGLTPPLLSFQGQIHDPGLARQKGLFPDHTERLENKPCPDLVL